MTFLPSLRIEATGLDTIIFDPYSGWVPQLFDPGFPVVREVAQNAPDADGTIDTTRYFGARNITLRLILDEVLSGVPLWQMEQRLRSFLAPSRRARLVGQFFQGGPEVQAWVRGSQFSAVVDAQQFRPVVAQWVCPSGLIESADLNSVTAQAGGEQPQSGLTFNASANFSFGGETQASGGAVATNSGTVPVWPVVTMYGPFSDGTELLNATTGESLVFDATLDVVAGDWVRVDFAAKTIVNSTGVSYYDTLDFPSSTWWQLQPGENRVYMLPDTFTAPPASLLVEWRDAWL